MQVLLFNCVWFIICLQFLSIKCTDPCDTYTLLNERYGAENRSIANVLNLTVHHAISDDRLTPEGWYRVQSNVGEEMPTSAPGWFRCGTWFPIWLNGDLPTTADGTVTRAVCVQTFTSDCDKTWNIRIKRCSGYYVYDLIKSTSVDSAYCFGNLTRCPPGQSSDTGYTPNCSADFPTDTFTPVVQASRKNGNISTPGIGFNLEPVFICSFSDTGDGYAYDVHWDINGQSVRTIKNTPFASISDTDLRPAHWKDTHHMNMNVKCSVRARNSIGSTPGFYSESDYFVAGVVPDKTVYEVDEGSNTTVNLRSTVPLGCVGSLLLPNCKETIKIGYPRNESCTSVSQSSAVITEECGTEIVANDSLAIRTLTVYGNVDNLYNQFNPRVTTIKFVHVPSSRDVSGAWDKVIIPDISVYIRDSDRPLLQRFCESSSDPYFITFDGRDFWSHHTGEYVLYRHKREPYWVHTLSSGCWWGSCNFGVAVRSHNSMFVVRTTDRIENPNSNPFERLSYSGSRSFPMVDFRSCDDKNMIITRDGIFDFKVKLPSGTEISFNIVQNWDWVRRRSIYFIRHIIIKPSVLDIGQTEGLCGFLSSNGDSSDDLLPRGQTTARQSADAIFINSWSISATSSESMFFGIPTFPENYFYRPFCTCATQATGSTPIADNFNEVNCNLTEPADQCFSSTTNLDTNLYSSCSRRKRREATFLERTHRDRRSTDDSDDIDDEPTPLTYADDFQEQYIPPDVDWPEGWTNESARAACEERFRGDQAVTVCIDYAETNTEDYILGCMTDIKLTNSTALMDNAVQALVAGCIIELSRNQTLILTQSDENSGESVLDVVKSQLCSNNCSNHGICLKGTCNCSVGYLGDDCSLTTAQPPSPPIIPGNGKCGKSERSCVKTNLFGMFESTDVWCQLHYFKIVDFIKTYPSTTYIVKAGYHGPDRISVQFESGRRRKRSTSDTIAEGYDISLSYDGTNFGESTSIIIYDENCYDCNATTTTCTSLDSCTLVNTSESTVSATVESNSTLDVQSPDTTDNSISSLVSETVTTQGNIQSSEKSISTSATIATTSNGNDASSDTQPTASQTTRNGEADSEGGGVNIAIIITAVVIVLCIVIGAAFVIYLKFKPKNTKSNIRDIKTGVSNETYDFSRANSIGDINAPNIPPWHTQLTRGKSDIVFDWATERPKTPEHLFLAKP